MHSYFRSILKPLGFILGLYLKFALLLSCLLVLSGYSWNETLAVNILGLGVDFGLLLLYHLYDKGRYSLLQLLFKYWNLPQEKKIIFERTVDSLLEEGEEYLNSNEKTLDLIDSVLNY